MNPIKTFFKFIYEDLKSDWEILKEIGQKIKKEEPIFNEKMKEEFTKGWGKFLKENWIFFMILILAFTVGYFVAGKHYQNVCNTFIWENYIITDPLYNLTKNIGNFSLPI